MEIQYPILAIENSSKRFQAELEFVQALSSPQYLSFLAQSNYLNEPEFLNFLKYLTYFKKPKYVKYILYPHCLWILDLLQEEDFRESLKKEEMIQFLHHQQYLHWKFRNI